MKFLSRISRIATNFICLSYKVNHKYIIRVRDLFDMRIGLA